MIENAHGLESQVRAAKTSSAGRWERRAGSPIPRCSFTGASETLFSFVVYQELQRNGHFVFRARCTASSDVGSTYLAASCFTLFRGKLHGCRFEGVCHAAFGGGGVISSCRAPYAARRRCQAQAPSEGPYIPSTYVTALRGGLDSPVFVLFFSPQIPRHRSVRFTFSRVGYTHRLTWTRWTCRGTRSTASTACNTLASSRTYG